MVAFCGRVWHATAATAGVAEGVAAIDKGHYRAALEELRPLAERGDAVAQYRLGWMYESGKAVTPDEARAMSWYRKAADQGNAAAQVALGALKEPAAAVAGTAPNPPMTEGVGAKGTLIYKSRAGTFTANLNYAWLVKGPNSMDPGRTLRHVILSATDIGPALQSCKTMMCADGQLTQGMTVDFDVGPRLNYWISLNGQKVQYSGTVAPDAFAARVNDARHLAGRLAIDDATAGGAKVDVEFNSKLSKEFKPER